MSCIIYKPKSANWPSTISDLARANPGFGLWARGYGVVRSDIDLSKVYHLRSDLLDNYLKETSDLDLDAVLYLGDGFHPELTEAGYVFSADSTELAAAIDLASSLTRYGDFVGAIVSILRWDSGGQPVAIADDDSPVALIGKWYDCEECQISTGPKSTAVDSSYWKGIFDLCDDFCETSPEDDLELIAALADDDDSIVIDFGMAEKADG